jgi:preprotein translocase subunit SecA
MDGLWIEHLTAIDDLREGIGLRAYGQRDPLIEYKVEAARMFDELQASVRTEVVHSIYKLQVTHEQAPPRRRPTIESGPDHGDETPSSANGAATRATPLIVRTAPPPRGNGASAPRQPIHVAPKVGRNQPCPCGSGKKYKFCHGRGNVPS